LFSIDKETTAFDSRFWGVIGVLERVLLFYALIINKIAKVKGVAILAATP
jgi:hypothetical protein